MFMNDARRDSNEEAAGGLATGMNVAPRVTPASAVDTADPEMPLAAFPSEQRSRLAEGRVAKLALELLNAAREAADHDQLRRDFYLSLVNIASAVGLLTIRQQPAVAARDLERAAVEALNSSNPPERPIVAFTEYDLPAEITLKGSKLALLALVERALANKLSAGQQDSRGHLRRKALEQVVAGELRAPAKIMEMDGSVPVFREA
jgi:hypothetical protein